MKRNYHSKLSVLSLIIFISVIAISCGDKKEQKNNSNLPLSEITTNLADASLPNYRYVDLDTVLSRYNLAKDYNEEMMRMQTTLESEVKRHENSIQSFANTMQNKMQNNIYLTEASYKADQDKITNMQTEAQKAVAALQTKFETAAMAAQKSVNDSINSFIESYNKTKGYDAIFFKAATLYINPALDITEEVIEGLNARYNKVK